MRIPIHVSPDSAEPMYHQIKEQLRALILAGQLEEGMLLPSNREFAADLNCSVITIRRVYQDLEQQGFLRTRQGTGTFVARVSGEQKNRFRKDAVQEVFESAVALGRKLGCTDHELRGVMERVITAGTGPPGEAARPDTVTSAEADGESSDGGER